MRWRTDTKMEEEEETQGDVGGKKQVNNRWDRMNRYGWEPEENANECVWEGGGGVQAGWKYVLLLFFPAVIKMTCSGHTLLHSSPPSPAAAAAAGAILLP